MTARCKVANELYYSDWPGFECALRSYFGGITLPDLSTISIAQLLAEAQHLAQETRTADAEALTQLWLSQNEDHLPVEDLVQAHKLLGALRHQAGNVEGAIAAFETATELDPAESGAWASYGLMLAASEQNELAIDALSKAVTLDPAHTAARKNLALAQMKMQRTDQAMDHYRFLCSQEAQDPTNWIWLGHAAAILGQPQEAHDAYSTALKIDPNNKNVQLTMALIERDLGDLVQSTNRLKGLYNTLSSDAVIAFALAQNHLQQGNFEAGFTLYERRWERPGMSLPDFKIPQWQGEDLQGKTVLLFDEQGLGDTLQFARFVSIIVSQASKVLLHVRPKLRSILSNLHDLGATEFIEDTSPQVERRADYHCPLLSIPFGLSIKSPSEIPNNSPYLTPTPHLVDHWQDELRDMLAKPGLKIGLIWQGDPQSQSEKGRSPPPSVLAPILENDANQFFLLQKFVGREDLSLFEGRANVTDLGDRLDLGPDAFVDTAAVMTLLDAVVTSDTGPAHLAGALGIPTGVLLKKVPEWRWGLDGPKTDWYPSMTLFRQKIANEWRDPILEVKIWIETMLEPALSK